MPGKLRWQRNCARCAARAWRVSAAARAGERTSSRRNRSRSKAACAQPSRTSGRRRVALSRAQRRVRRAPAGPEQQRSARAHLQCPRGPHTHGKGVYKVMLRQLTPQAAVREAPPHRAGPFWNHGELLLCRISRPGTPLPPSHRPPGLTRRRLGARAVARAAPRQTPARAPPAPPASPPAPPPPGRGATF